MASATPDLRLPSQSQDIAAPRLVPNYTAWWQRHVCEQLAQGCYLTAARPGFELATSRVASHYTIKLLVFLVPGIMSVVSKLRLFCVYLCTVAASPVYHKSLFYRTQYSLYTLWWKFIAKTKRRCLLRTSHFQQVHWHRWLWSTEARAPCTSNSWIFSQLTLQLHKVWQRLCAVASTNSCYMQVSFRG